jgi:hypothetical protein
MVVSLRSIPGYLMNQQQLGVAAASVRKITLAYCTQCSSPLVRTGKMIAPFGMTCCYISGEIRTRSTTGISNVVERAAMWFLARFPSRDWSKVNATNPAR